MNIKIEIDGVPRECVWIVSEVFYPEETGTGYVLTRIAEGLANHYHVRVLCGQPTYFKRGTRAPVTEIHNGVQIRRCPASTLNKDVFLFRIINLITISVSILIHAFWLIKRSDKVLVVTNPPLLPFFVALTCRVRGAKFVLIAHDVYPDIMIATGMLRAGSLAARLGEWLNKILYQNADRITALGRDMRVIAQNRLPPQNRHRVSVIPNWADTDEIIPCPRENNALLKELGLEHKFVIEYAGNMGYPNDIESILASAEELKDEPAIHFLFLGSGVKREWLQENVGRRKLNNVTVIGSRPRTEQLVFLNACDVAIVSLIQGMKGLAVPSRTYNILAAGKPIIAIMEEGSEVGLVIQEEQIGWIVPPHQPSRLAQAILNVYADPNQLLEMGKRAREAAETRFSFGQVVDQYRQLIEGLV